MKCTVNIKRFERHITFTVLRDGGRLAYECSRTPLNGNSFDQVRADTLKWICKTFNTTLEDIRLAQGSD